MSNRFGVFLYMASFVALLVTALALRGQGWLGLCFQSLLGPLHERACTPAAGLD